MILRQADIGSSRESASRSVGASIGFAVVAIAASACSGSATGHVSDTSSRSSNQPPTTRHHPKKKHHATQQPVGHVPYADLPRPSLTPGATFPAGRVEICVSGYSTSVRNVPQSEKDAVYARYDIAHVPYAHEVDHLVSLELGGSNAITNLWPEPYAGRWGARTKDTLENRLHDLVCTGKLRLRYAQRIEATNWVKAYRRYVGGTPMVIGGPSGGSGGGTRTDPNGFYASSYPSASTIYCADDGAWQSLSKTYLVHFAGWAAAHTRFPGYHLHRSC
jgi:hypothetical protein